MVIVMCDPPSDQQASRHPDEADAGYIYQGKQPKARFNKNVGLANTLIDEL